MYMQKYEKLDFSISNLEVIGDAKARFNANDVLKKLGNKILRG